jgi:hypothetical protein
MTNKIMPVVSTFECDANNGTKFQQLSAPLFRRSLCHPIYIALDQPIDRGRLQPRARAAGDQFGTFLFNIVSIFERARHNRARRVSTGGTFLRGAR